MGFVNVTHAMAAEVATVCAWVEECVNQIRLAFVIQKWVGEVMCVRFLDVLAWRKTAVVMANVIQHFISVRAMKVGPEKRVIFQTVLVLRTVLVVDCAMLY